MSYTLTTQTGCWHPCHRVETRDAHFAHLLFEQALSIDIEPDFERTRKGFVVEFVSALGDCHTAIQNALSLAGSAK